jgi:beta-lactamase regulating signal transducer with metallopeptidase domain
MSGLGVSTGAWLLHSAAGGGLLLLLVWGLVRRTRQPARQQRLGEWGVLAALLLAVLSLAPAWLVLRIPLPAPAAAEGPPAPERPSLPPANAVAETVPEEQPAGSDAAEDAPAPAPAAGAEQPGDTPAATERAETPPAAGPRGWALPSATDLLACLGLAYVLVAAVLVGRWLLAHLALWRLLRATEPAPAPVARLLADAAPCQGRPRLLVSHRLRVPVSCGLLRPTVVLPAALCDRPAALRWVLAHELTHLERHDPWTCLLFGLGQAVYFYLPWFWWLRRQVGLCQEFIADAAVASQEPAPEEYAQFLLSLTGAPPAPAGAAGVAGRPSDLFRRVTMLLGAGGPVEKRCPRLWSWAAAGGLGALAVVASGVGLQAVAAPAPHPDDPGPAAVAPPAPAAPPAAAAEGASAHTDTPAPPASPEQAGDAARHDRLDPGAFAVPPDPFERARREWQEAFAGTDRRFPSRLARPDEGRLGLRVSRPGDDLVDQLDLRRGEGLVVDEVRPDSPAARAGLRPHDILLSLDGKPVPTDARRFAQLVEELRAEVPLAAVVLRKGQRQTLTGLLLPAALPAGRPRLPGPAYPAVPPGGGLTSLFRRGDQLTIHYQDGPVSITIIGTTAGHEFQVAEVIVQAGGAPTRYGSLDRVPPPYRGKAGLLLELANPHGDPGKARVAASEQPRGAPEAGR